MHECIHRVQDVYSRLTVHRYIGRKHPKNIGRDAQLAGMRLNHPVDFRSRLAASAGPCRQI